MLTRAEPRVNVRRSGPRRGQNERPAARSEGEGGRAKTMATREEIVDAMAGMALFADLASPQLQGVAHRFEERFFPEGSGSCGRASAGQPST